MFDPVSWSELGKQYGPFFFAILFLMVITRWAYKIYRRANLRTDPPASAKEKSTYRYYFIATASFGMSLVIVSVVWWWINQPSLHVFRGEIRGLTDYEVIASDEFYFKPTEVKIPGEEVIRIRNEHFVFIQDKPIPENQKFQVYYRKRNGPVEDFSIKYIPGLIAEYKIEWDSLTEKNIIRDLTPSSGITGIFSFNTAYAQSEPPTMKKQFPRQKMNLQYTDFSRSTENLVDLLQDEHSDVGRKIEVLDVINNMDDEKFREFMETTTPGEPLLLTILELGRHSDKELAYKARKIINDRVDLHSDLTGKLLSDDPAAREEATSFLFRIEPPKAEDILNSIPEQEQTPFIIELKEKIIAGDNSKVLIPTGSEDGDRYYVRANWDPDDRNVVDCLTRLFNDELINNRTLEEEMEIMSDRDTRLVYWYSKEWALGIAGQIKECGGAANFVGF